MWTNCLFPNDCFSSCTTVLVVVSCIVYNRSGGCQLYRVQPFLWLSVAIVSNHFGGCPRGVRETNILLYICFPYPPIDCTTICVWQIVWQIKRSYLILYYLTVLVVVSFHRVQPFLWLSVVIVNDRSGGCKLSFCTTVLVVLSCHFVQPFWWLKVVILYNRSGGCRLLLCITIRVVVSCHCVQPFWWLSVVIVYDRFGGCQLSLCITVLVCFQLSLCTTVLVVVSCHRVQPFWLVVSCHCVQPFWLVVSCDRVQPF